MLRRLSFNFWYFFRPPWDSGVSPPELIEFISTHPPARALDVGCGSGTNVVTLAQHGWQVTGVDFAPRAIQIARHKARQANVMVQLLVADATRLDGIDGPFELALDLGCFHGIANREAYLKALARVLVPGGYWLLYGFFRSTCAQSGPGLDDATLDLIRSHGFELHSRRDGTDKRERPSAWLLYQRSAAIR